MGRSSGGGGRGGGAGSAENGQVTSAIVDFAQRAPANLVQSRITLTARRAADAGFTTLSNSLRRLEGATESQQRTGMERLARRIAASGLVSFRR